MTSALNHEHLARIVNIVCDLADGNVVEEQIAILWTVRTCLEKLSTKGTAEAVKVICQTLRANSGCEPIAGAGPKHDGFADPVYCRVFGTFCGILASDIPDPSDGACRFHRHDAVPHWSRRLEPTALIGRYFFYNDPLHPCKPERPLPQPELGLAYS